MNEKNIYLDMELLYKFDYVFGSILALKILDEVPKMQNKMNMKNETHKCVPRNSQINLSAQEFE